MPFSAPADYVGAIVAPGAAAEALWLVFREGACCWSRDPANALPGVAADVPAGSRRCARCTSARWARATSSRPNSRAEVEAPPGWRWSDLRSLYGRLATDEYALAGRGLQLIDWDRTHQFCGRCGTPHATCAATNGRASARPAAWSSIRASPRR